MPLRDVLGSWDTTIPQSVSITCAWCGRDVEAPKIGPTVEDYRERRGAGRTYVVRTWATHIGPRDPCQKPSLIATDFYDESGDQWAFETVAQIPWGHSRPMEHLPEPIEDVRSEAWACFHGGQYRASLVMGRATVQRAVRTLGGEGRDLFREIEDLARQGKVTMELSDWAHEVRLAARDAAHPYELDEVSKADAEPSLAFMDAFLEHAVALPARRAALRAAREQTHEDDAP